MKRTTWILAAASAWLTAGAALAAHHEAPLKDAFADAFRIGVALNRAQIMGEDDGALSLTARQFNSVTAENVMKWEEIEPAEGQFDWTAADALVAFAEAHGMEVAGHVLVWHQQTPDWVFQGPDGGPATRELLLERMQSHIAAVVGRYKGRVHAWEAVNEALNEDGTLRRTPWLEIIGEDYLQKAFEFARAADPEAHLYYNDYGLHNPAKRAGAVRLVKALQDAGVRVDGVGIQGHYGLDNPRDLQDFEDSITAFAALGTQVHITEMDVSVLPFPDQQDWGADLDVDLELDAKYNPYADGLPAAVEQQQIDQYTGLFRIMLDHRDMIGRVTFWGLSDGDSWKNGWPMRGRTDYPLLFDRDRQPKPVFHAVTGLTAGD
ncbi:MAG: endo-1,4-beta-xylanase [Xanthomonadales bacterium]